MLAYSTLTVKELWEQCQRKRDDNNLRLILADALDEDEYSGQVNADKEFADFIRRFSLGDGEAKCTYEEFRGFWEAYQEIGVFKTVCLTTPPDTKFDTSTGVPKLSIMMRDGMKKTVRSNTSVVGEKTKRMIPPDHMVMEVLKRMWPNVTFVIAYHPEPSYAKT